MNLHDKCETHSMKGGKPMSQNVEINTKIKIHTQTKNYFNTYYIILLITTDQFGKEVT